MIKKFESIGMVENTELNKRFERLEERLDHMPPTDGGPLGDIGKINLIELVSLVWRGKLWVIFITCVFSVVGVVYSLGLSDVYRSQGIYASAKQESSSGAGQLGGLAAIAGINLSDGDSNRIGQALVVMNSWPFLDSWVQKYKLAPQIVALKGWDSNLDRLVYDNEIYDVETNQWLTKPGTRRSFEPSSIDVYKKLSKMLSISQDKKTGLVTVSIEHYSPKLANEWLGSLIFELNEYYRDRDIKEAQAAVTYLKGKLSETSLAGIQVNLYHMIESQLNTLMLAEVSPEYLIETVVPHRVAEEKSGPQRSIIVLMAMVFGGFVGVIIVLLVSSFGWGRY